MSEVGSSSSESATRIQHGPMRVLHIYSGNLFGGVERFLVTLVRKRQAAPAMSSEFALCFDGRLGEELSAAGATIHKLSPVRFSRPWTLWRARRLLRDLLSRERYDVVVTHSGWLHAAFAATVVASRQNSRPRLVRWVHETPSGGWIDRRAAKTPPDLWIANSRHTLGADGVSATKRVIYLPVAPPPGEVASEREHIRASLQCPPDRVVVLCFSRLERWKGHGELLAGLARAANDKSWLCWIAGGPQRPEESAYLQELQQQAQALGIADRVKFLGERRDMPAVIAAADVHCQPNSGPEPFGIAFIEAMYGGLAVVTTALGGAKEIVEDGVSGMLVPPDDPAVLSEALGRVFGDAAFRSKLGNNARRRAAELCVPDRQMRQIEDVLRDTL